MVLTEKPKRSNGSHMFTFDVDTLYTPYFEDFGPPNIAKIYRFSVLLERKLEVRFSDKAPPIFKKILVSRQNHELAILLPFSNNSHHEQKMSDKKIYFYSDHEPKHRMNAAFLLGAFLVRTLSSSQMYTHCG